MNKYFLTEDQEMIQEMARKFADEVVAPTVTELDRKHLFPEDQIKQLGEMGFLGAEVPEEYGGAGLGCLLSLIHICFRRDSPMDTRNRREKIKATSG